MCAVQPRGLRTDTYSHRLPRLACCRQLSVIGLCQLPNRTSLSASCGYSRRTLPSTTSVPCGPVVPQPSVAAPRPALGLVHGTGPNITGRHTQWLDKLFINIRRTQLISQCRLGKVSISICENEANDQALLGKIYLISDIRSTHEVLLFIISRDYLHRYN